MCARVTGGRSVWTYSPRSRLSFWQMDWRGKKAAEEGKAKGFFRECTGGEIFRKVPIEPEVDFDSSSSFFKRKRGQ